MWHDATSIKFYLCPQAIERS